VLLSPPHLTGGEIAALEATLGSGWVAPAGPVPAAFEAALSAATGFGQVLATASGTAALHLGYRCLGVSAGDEVWTSALTFIATVAPAVQMGATPRFLDVEPESWTLDPDLLERELARAARAGRLPRAVVPVDLFGQPCDLDAIVALCDRWGVPVMCDSAGALGATGRGGRHAGRGARLAVFSFNGNKIVTAGGGGALVSDEPGGLVARARALSQAAREPGPHYQHETTGHSYGMSSLWRRIIVPATNKSSGHKPRPAPDGAVSALVQAHPLDLLELLQPSPTGAHLAFATHTRPDRGGMSASATRMSPSRMPRPRRASPHTRTAYRLGLERSKTSRTRSTTPSRKPVVLPPS
jgi:hypothetical protein